MLAGGVEFNDQPATIEIKKLPAFNPLKLESDFEKQVHYWLTNYIEKRNKSENFITLHNQIVSCGQKRLDFVLYNERTKNSAVVEVDGNYHFNQGVAAGTNSGVTSLTDNSGSSRSHNTVNRFYHK